MIYDCMPEHYIKNKSNKIKNVIKENDKSDPKKSEFDEEFHEVLSDKSISKS